jgi:hypothetical protein
LASGLDGVAAELRGLVQEQDAVVREDSTMYVESADRQPRFSDPAQQAVDRAADL